jgi:hypothetical protein
MTPSTLSEVGSLVYTWFIRFLAFVVFASPGTPPKQAQEPKDTMSADFLRSSLAMCSFSLLRMAPL